MAKEKKEKIRKCVDDTLTKMVAKKKNHTEIKWDRRKDERENEERKERKKVREGTKTIEKEKERDERVILRIRKEGK